MDSFYQIWNMLGSIDEKTLPILSIVISTISAVLSLIIAIFGVWFAVAQYRLKRSIKISAEWKLSQYIYFKSDYVETIIIQNLKDKSETIFSIHLRVGHNLYITLENMEDNPLILQPFETITRNYKPVTFYGSNQYKLNINKALKFKKCRVVLSTSKGKYVTKIKKTYWKPIIESLYNHYVVAIQCIQVEDTKPDGRKIIIPNSTQYIVRYKQNNEDKSIDIFRSGHCFSDNYKPFKLKEKHLDNKTELKNHLKSLTTLETENCIELSSIEVIDVEEISEMKRMNDFYHKEIELTPTGWIQVKLLGKTYTFLSKYKMNLKNHDRYKKNLSYNEKNFLKFFFFFLLPILTLAIILKTL